MTFENTRETMDRGLSTSFALSRQYECDLREFTPAMFAQARAVLRSITDQPIKHAMLGGGLWTTVVGEPVWHSVIDPVSSHAELLDGKLFYLLGMTMWSDCYMQPDQQFLRPLDVIIFTEDPAVALLLRVKVFNGSGLRPLQLEGKR